MSKENQIEEAAHRLCGQPNGCNECVSDYRCEFLTECAVLHNAGYRKQIEGEWVWDREHSNYKCSLCGEYDIGVPKFCRECGARMKGGAKE